MPGGSPAGQWSRLQEVAKQFGVHRATIERWVARYRHQGLEGLRGPVHDARGWPPNCRGSI
ncbi:MAG: helix-turn-helix domain-containing protein [Terriglobia bacterium]